MQPQDRLHSLDAVRGFALLLGIVFHATMSFIPTLASLGWPIVDNAPSTELSAAFFVLHIFRMTMFFVVAGFFARLVIYRKGATEFLKDRRKRILFPLLVGWPVIMVLFTPSFIWAIAKQGTPFVPPEQIQPALTPFPLTHLWFLYVLLLLYVAVLGVRWLANNFIDRGGSLRLAIDAFIAKLARLPLLPIILAIPLALSLYFTSWWNFWIGIPTPDNSLVPNAPAFVGYATAVFCGWFLHRQAHLLGTFERYWLGYFAVALALTVAAYLQVGMPTTPITLSGSERVLYAGTYCMAIWCWTFALIGAAARFLSGESAVRRYLADASYWMYLMHLPLVFALQAWVMHWSLHWSIKFAFILSVTFALLLLSYHYWVRPTYMGEVLNGRRYPRLTSSPSSTNQDAPTPTLPR